MNAHIEATFHVSNISNLKSKKQRKRSVAFSYPKLDRQPNLEKPLPFAAITVEYVFSFEEAIEAVSCKTSTNSSISLPYCLEETTLFEENLFEELSFKTFSKSLLCQNVFKNQRPFIIKYL